MPGDDAAVALSHSNEIGGDFLKDLLTSKPCQPQEFDMASVSTRCSDLPMPNFQKSLCKACPGLAYHGPYCKPHTNAYNSLSKAALKNGESESNGAFLRFINIFGSRKKDGSPQATRSLLAVCLSLFWRGFQRAKQRGESFVGSCFAHRPSKMRGHGKRN